jgi:predicted P-loop ATPase
MADNVVKLPVSTPPPNAEEQARADSERRQRLFDWAEAVLTELGLTEAVARAQSKEELLAITLDVNNAEVAVAIRDALHPALGKRADHFRGLKEGSLKAILKNRFAELKKDREAEIKRGHHGGGEPDWTDELCHPFSCLANFSLILRKHPAWKGVFARNQFNGQVVIRKRPPYDESPGTNVWTDADLSDRHERGVRIWFQRTVCMKPAVGDVGRAIAEAADHNPFHPVRDYLNRQVWDGTPRLESWLHTYFHVEDTEYVRAIGPRWLIQAVARIFQPGCKADYVLVLEGPQGLQKSEALRTLAVNPKWYTGRISNIGGKDAIIEILGIWIIEDAELRALDKASTNESKSFLTERDDRVRLPWDKYASFLSRSCVFAATINPTGNGYLKDSTGARRYWPVFCDGVIDLAGLEQVRDQLWAEAVHLHRAGHAAYLETPELEALARAEQDARRFVDPWEAPIREWVKNRIDVGRLEDVIEGALQIDPKYQTQTVLKRVAAILMRLGFTKRRPRNGENRTWKWQRDPQSGTAADPSADDPDPDPPKRPSFEAAMKAARREAKRRANNTDSTADIRRALRRAAHEIT